VTTFERGMTHDEKFEVWAKTVSGDQAAAQYP
jgi:hypothetical protein